MGRIDEMWMTCRASLTAAVLDVRRMGMRCGRAPPGTRLRVRAILAMRLSLTHITISDSPLLLSCSFLPLPLLPLSKHCHLLVARYYRLSCFLLILQSNGARVAPSTGISPPSLPQSLLVGT